MPMKLTNETWLYDSGACSHYRGFVEGIMNEKDINNKITIVNGYTMVATKPGGLKCGVS
jgi:hypothetical protein